MQTAVLRIAARDVDAFPISVTGAVSAAGRLRVAELDAFDTRGTWTGFTRANQPTDDIARIGGMIRDLLDAAGVGVALRGLPSGTRLLIDIEAPEVRCIPWELALGDHDPVSVDPVRPLSRLVQAAGNPVRPDWPLKVLVVIAPDPVLAAQADTRLDGEGELLRIRTALTGFREAGNYRSLRSDVDIVVERTPTREALRARIKRFSPDLLHVIAHGQFNPNSARTWLEIYDGSSTWEWHAADVRDDLRASHVPAIVVLNACLAADGRAAADQSVALAFSTVGVGAVVASQAEIYDQSSLDFARELYTSLGRGESIDVAVTRARNALRAKHGAGIRDWAAPVLFVRDSIALNPAIGSSNHAVRARIQSCGLFRGLRGFVGRQAERSEAWAWAPDGDARVVVVTGDREIGKSWFVRAIAERRALAGDFVRLVSLGPQTLDALGYARRMVVVGDQPGAQSCEVTAPLPLQHFEDFIAKARELGGLPPLANGVPLRRDHIPGALTVGQDGRVDDLYNHLRGGFDALVNELSQARQFRSLLVVIDGFGSVVPATFQSYVVPYLIEWAFARTDFNVQLILVDEAAALNRLDIDRSGLLTVNLTAFPREHAEQLVKAAARQIHVGFPDELPTEDPAEPYWNFVDPFVRIAQTAPACPPRHIEMMAKLLEQTFPGKVELE